MNIKQVQQVKHVHEMKAIIILFSFIFLTSFQGNLQAPVSFPEFEKYIIKNYRVTKQQKSECKFYYASIVVQTDKINQIVDLQFKNDISEDMKTSFNFIKGYQFSEKYKINGRSVLFFLTVDQQDICPGVVDSSCVTNLVLKESLATIEEQLQKEPNTIILYKVVPIKVFKPRH